MILKRSAALSVLAALVLAGCASNSITVSVNRAPTINTTGIRRIAIMPFTTSDNSSLQREVAAVITNTATTKINETRHFTLVAPAQIQDLQAKNESIENHVDALFSGQVVTLNVNESSRQVERYDYKTDSTYMVTIYRREVELAFNFSFFRARDGSIVGTATRMGRNAHESENRDTLQTASRLAQTIISNRLQYLNRDVAPYVAQEKRTFMTETSKDKNLQNQMKAIFALVKEGSYKSALSGYLDTFKTFNSIAAAVNAAYLHEALGELQEAADLMAGVFQETGNPRARTELDRVNKLLEEAGLLSTEYADTRNQREKVQEFAIGEIRKVIPANAKVWIVNKSERGERELALQVVDGITSGLINGGITVVDRNNTRLIEAEERFQTSGAVNDDDLMNIGNAAGADTMISIEVTGVGSMRRLKLEILNMSTRTAVYASDTSENWHL